MTKEIKVLLVDDEASFVSTMAKRLERRGFSVFQAFGGLECLDILHKHPVDVVILDVNMPDMDGLRTLREIKLHFPAVEVLILTGHADMEATITGMAMGSFDYLMKPVGLEELIRKITEAWARHRPFGEADEVDDHQHTLGVAKGGKTRRR